MNVIKRDGKTQEFTPDKIKNSITAAIKDTGAKPEDKKQMIDKVSNEVIESIKNKDQVKTSEIKQMILQKLMLADAKVADAWKKYEEGKKKPVAK